MDRKTIDEQLREATREVAEAFRVSVARVEHVVERLEREALREAFGSDPRSSIATALAAEMRREVEEGLENVHPHKTPPTHVVDFPSEARRSQA